MKTLNKNFIAFTLAFLFTFSFFSCSDEDSDAPQTDSGVLNIQARSTVNGSSSSRVVNNLEITTFKINISEIELEFDLDDDNDDSDDDINDDLGTYDDDGYVDSDDEIELEGPFELDILNGTSNIVTITIPQGTYEEIEFEFDKNENPNSELFNKTILIEGTIDGTPFEFWYDLEEEIEIDYENATADINIENGINAIIINFDLDTLFDPNNGVDLSQASDGDGDGLIEINPNDDDGNSDIADAIDEKLEDIIDLLDN